MTSPVTRWRVRTLAVLGAVVLCAAPVAAGQATHAFEGRLLTDALHRLQRSGLRIVFTSAIVTPDMRVVAEPRASNPRQQLDELLAPHGLKAVPGPRSVIQVVRGRTADATRSRKPVRRAAASGVTEETGVQGGAYAEQVIVIGSPREREDRGVASQVTLDAKGLRSGRSVLQDDPLQAVQALPGVAAADDFRSEFSVRGSPYRHIGVVVDGVATPWLVHSVYGHGDAGSVSMFGSDSIGEATLQAGAYPRRFDDRLGAQLELTLREGSRDVRRFQASLGGTSAGFVAEGPVGAQKRGSWLVSLRNSYLTWPVRRHTENGTAFAFGDAHAKLVYDVKPSQQLTLTVLGGRSTLDWREEPLGGGLAEGTNRAALVSVGWQSSLGAKTVIRQRASLVGHTFINTRTTGQTASRGINRAFSYRGEMFRALFGGTIEAGGELGQSQGARVLAMDGAPPDEFGARWWTRSTYVHFTRNISRQLALAAGVRAADSTLVHDQTLAPWVLADWSFKPGWTVNASVGMSHQFPELEHVFGVSGSPALGAERATHADIGVQQRLANGVRWQATLFNRLERNVLRAPGWNPGLVDGGAALDSPVPGRYMNALDGASRGVELLVARDSARRLSGWVSYTFGIMRQTDTTSGETFWGDFDRRHSFNATGVFRATDKTSMGIVLRGGTNVPIPGYLDARSGALFIGDRPNRVRLPYYARLDARAERTFTSSGRISVFAEVLNVLNRQNQASADGSIQPISGEAIGFTRALLARRPSVGVVIGFGGP